MRLRRLATTSFLILVVPLQGIAGAPDYNDYHECILGSMKGVKSDSAASFISAACYKLYNKEKKTKSRALSTKEEAQLTRAGTATLSNAGWLTGDIYNGNPNITVTEITLTVTTTSGGKKVTRSYTGSVSIKPQSIGTFGFKIINDDHDSIHWGISGAKGY